MAPESTSDAGLVDKDEGRGGRVGPARNTTRDNYLFGTSSEIVGASCIRWSVDGPARTAPGKRYTSCSKFSGHRFTAFA